MVLVFHLFSILLYVSQGRLQRINLSYKYTPRFLSLQDERLRKELHNQVLELKGNIRVFARIRPSERVLSGEAKESSKEGASSTKVS